MSETNEAYEEYMEERVTIDDVEIIAEGSRRLYRGKVIKNIHPDHRRSNSQVRTASFHQVGDVVEINESWFL